MHYNIKGWKTNVGVLTCRRVCVGCGVMPQTYKWDRRKHSVRASLSEDNVIIFQVIILLFILLLTLIQEHNSRFNVASWPDLIFTTALARVSWRWAVHRASNSSGNNRSITGPACDPALPEYVDHSARRESVWQMATDPGVQRSQT